MLGSPVVIDRIRWREWAQRLLPWALFAALLAWGWRTTDLFHTVPDYGDVLEGLWAITWYAETLRAGSNPAVYPLAFHPQGWNVITYAWGPANFVLLLPLNRLGGPAFAYNVATLLTYAIAFAGMLQLAQRFVSRLAAAVVALLFTFWGLRWYNNVGQLNVALASALLPWMLWSLERGLASTRRPAAWCAVAGVFWSVSIYSTLYFIWLGGMALLVWIVARLGFKRSNWRLLGPRLALVPLVAGLLSLPFLVVYAQASSSAAAPSFSIYDVNVLGASLNSFPIPAPNHPLLGGLARLVYHGPPEGETNLTNFGLVGFVLALAGVWAGRRAQKWRPVLALAAVGLVLALGLTLKWDDQPVQIGLLRPLDELIWRIGYRLNPTFYFVGPEVPPGFSRSVPLPGLALATLVPLYAEARVMARYALLAGLAVFLLAGLGLDQVKCRWLQIALAGLLVLEVVPPPTQSYAFPPPSHPVYAWLQQQSLDGEGIVEVYTETDMRLAMPIGGAAIWATQDHRQPTAGGASSILPGHTAYLRRWLAEHPHPFQHDDFVSLLRAFRIRYVLLSMTGGGEERSLVEAQQNEELRFVQCFPPASQAIPYDNTVCVLEVQPSRTPGFNLLFREGWSGQEDWGRWIDGAEARAAFVATGRGPHRLRLQAFPFCVPGQQQQVSVTFNGTQIAEHTWPDCEPWSADIPVPAGLVQVGANDVTITAGYAVRPGDIPGDESDDPRTLSIGVTNLRLIPDEN